MLLTPSQTPHSRCAVRATLTMGALLLSLACQSDKSKDAPAGDKAASAKPSAAMAAADQAATTKSKAEPSEAEKRARLKAVFDARAARQSKEGAPHAQNNRGKQLGSGSVDPTGGKFSLEQALDGLEGSGTKLLADIKTDLGTLKCELWPDKAPITVANFAGLARGTRPWKSGGQWVNKPLYDGTTFHRIIKGFMIQGGDPNGNGSGGPGYVIPDEIWPGASHDTRGQLCMANRGPNTNGAQFFIMDGAAKHLDGGYTIFGQCGPEGLVEKLASTPMNGRRPAKAPKIKTVSIHRG